MNITYLTISETIIFVSIAYFINKYLTNNTKDPLLKLQIF